MSKNISFDNDQFKYKSRSILGQSEIPKMTKFLMNKGIVKNEKQAMGILSLLVLIFFVLTIFIIYINFFKTTYCSRYFRNFNRRKTVIGNKVLINLPQ